MPAQYVKPHVQTNKSDYLDAETRPEAVQRPRRNLSIASLRLSHRFGRQARGGTRLSPEG